MRDLLLEIDEALHRMKARGHQETFNYSCLVAKRNAIACGASYQIVDVTHGMRNEIRASKQ